LKIDQDRKKLTYLRPKFFSKENYRQVQLETATPAVSGHFKLQLPKINFFIRDLVTEITVLLRRSGLIIFKIVKC
jgi:hypothetical protein